jgi:hypothetical protein
MNSSTLPSRFSRRTHALCALAWIVAVSTGLLTLVAHTNAPGETAAVRREVPAESKIGFSADRFTLVMFVHPHCPCSMASMRELARVRSRHPEAADIQVWFYRPAGEGNDWVQTSLWDLARQTAAREPLIDDEGRVAASLGARTSGHALLFDDDRQLLYSGGITSSRGHEGDSVNVQSLERLLRRESAQFVQYPVFGCPILALSRSDHE